jgi:hypothetical protein
LAAIAGAFGLTQFSGDGVRAQTGPRRGDEARSPAPAASGTAPAATGSATALPGGGGDKLAWGAEFAQWARVTGYLLSRDHGSRLALIRATPPAAAELHMASSERLRELRPLGTVRYPVGTVLAMETWEIEANMSQGAPGPLFFMRKEAAGYDPQGGDWRYAMTRPDFTVLAEGKDGKATACRACHLTMKDRDFVPARDR